MQTSTIPFTLQSGLPEPKLHHLPGDPTPAAAADGSTLTSVRIYRSHSNVADALRAGDMLVVSPLAGAAAAALAGVGGGLSLEPTAAAAHTSAPPMVMAPPQPRPPPSASAASGDVESDYSLLGLPASSCLLPEAPPLQLHPDHPHHHQQQQYNRVLDCSTLVAGVSPLAPIGVEGQLGPAGYMAALQGGATSQPPHLRWASPCIITPTSSGSLDSLDTPTLSPALGRSYSAYLRDRSDDACRTGPPGPSWPPSNSTTARASGHQRQPQQQQHLLPPPSTATAAGVPGPAAGAGNGGLMAALIRRRQRLDHLQHQQPQHQQQQRQVITNRGHDASQERQTAGVAAAPVVGIWGGVTTTTQPQSRLQETKVAAAGMQHRAAPAPGPSSQPMPANSRPTRRAAAAAVAAWNTALVTGDDWGDSDAAATSDGSGSGESDFSSDTDSDGSDMEVGATGAMGAVQAPMRMGVSRFAGALGRLITSPHMQTGCSPGAAAATLKHTASGGGGGAAAAGVSIAPRRRAASRRGTEASDHAAAAAAVAAATTTTSPAASGGAGTKRRKAATTSSRSRQKRSSSNAGVAPPAAPAAGGVRRTATACSSNTTAVALAAALGGGGGSSPTASSAQPTAAAGGGGGGPVAAAPEGGSTSSQYRGVTRHRRSGRWEAHLWIKELGRQVYLGGYEDEAAAAQAYDLAVLRSKGAAAVTNFPAERYRSSLAQLAGVSIEEMIMAVRRQSQGFSRGTSSHRGVTAHPSGRWEARIGIPGSRHVYLGLYEGEGEAAAAYDASLVRLRGLTAATNFSLARYSQQLAEHYQLQEVLSSTAPEEVGHVLTPHGEQGPDFEAWIKQGAAAVGLMVGPVALERTVAELGAKAGAEQVGP